MESVERATVRASAPKRLALAAAMAFVAMNVWIGGPIVALWVGAQLQRQSNESLTIRPTTALAVFATLGLVTFGLAKLLRLVSDAYDRATDVAPAGRKHDSWISAERKSYVRQPLTTLERILVVVVAIAGIAFEIWFMFFSTSPIDGRSGRGAVPLAQSGQLQVALLPDRHETLAADEAALAARPHLPVGDGH